METEEITYNTTRLKVMWTWELENELNNIYLENYKEYLKEHPFIKEEEFKV